MKVILEPAVNDQVLADYQKHAAASKNETGWLMLGYLEGDETQIKHAIHCPGEATPTSFKFDPDFLVNEVFEAMVKDDELTILGTIHSHPPGYPRPSSADLEAQAEWIDASGLKRAVWGVITEDGLRFFVIQKDRGRYEEIRHELRAVSRS